MEHTIVKRQLEELTTQQMHGLLLELANSGDDSTYEHIEKDIFAVLRQREETAWEEQRISPEALKTLMEQHTAHWMKTMKEQTQGKM